MHGFSCSALLKLNALYQASPCGLLNWHNSCYERVFHPFHMHLSVRQLKVPFEGNRGLDAACMPRLRARNPFASYSFYISGASCLCTPTLAFFVLCALTHHFFAPPPCGDHKPHVRIGAVIVLHHDCPTSIVTIMMSDQPAHRWKQICAA